MNDVEGELAGVGDEGRCMPKFVFWAVSMAAASASRVMGLRPKTGAQPQKTIRLRRQVVDLRHIRQRSRKCEQSGGEPSQAAEPQE